MPINPARKSPPTPPRFASWASFPSLTFFVSFRHQADGKGTRAKGITRDLGTLRREGKSHHFELIETKSVIKNTGGERRPAGNFGNYTDQTRKLPDIASRFDNLFLLMISSYQSSNVDIQTRLQFTFSISRKFSGRRGVKKKWQRHVSPKERKKEENNFSRRVSFPPNPFGVNEPTSRDP